IIRDVAALRLRIVLGAASVRPVIYDSQKPASVADSRGAISPVLRSFSAKSSPMVESHRAVSSSMGAPEIKAATSISTRSLIVSAVRLLILPSQSVLRLPWGSRKRMRRLPFLSLLMLATSHHLQF